MKASKMTVAKEDKVCQKSSKNPSSSWLVKIKDKNGEKIVVCHSKINAKVENEFSLSSTPASHFKTKYGTYDHPTGPRILFIINKLT